MSPLRVSGLAAILALITVSTTAKTRPQTTQIPGTAPIDPHRAMLTTYCVTCHNGRAKVGGLALDGLNIQAPAENADIWEKALRKLRGRLMPPPGNPQPQQKDIDSFIAWMETTSIQTPKDRRPDMCRSSG